MTDPEANDFEGTFDFFILTGFREGPRSVREISHRVQWAERLFLVAATRKGKQSPGSVDAALDRLCSEGSLQREFGAETIYALTDVGEQRLEQERARRHAAVSQFVEDAELDGSFRKFLERNGPF